MPKWEKRQEVFMVNIFPATAYRQPSEYFGATDNNLQNLGRKFLPQSNWDIILGERPVESVRKN